MDITIRPFRWSDLQAIAELTTKAVELDRSETSDTIENLEHYFNSKNFQAEEDAFVAETHTGSVVGYAAIHFLAKLGEGRGRGCVYPEYRHRGIGTQLVRATDARFIDKLTRLGTNVAMTTIQRNIYETNSGGKELLNAEGYAIAYSTCFLQRSLDDAIQPPSFPPNITLSPFIPNEDARQVYETEIKCFSQLPSYTPMPYEAWHHYFLENPAFNADFCLVARHRHDIIGIAINMPWGKDKSTLGYTYVLGVCEPWRKHGLGLALLQQTFLLFQQSGFTESGLAVDVDNNNTAFKLYQRAGMHVHNRLSSYRRSVGINNN